MNQSQRLQEEFDRYQFIKDILNETEISELEAMNERPMLLGALKKVLLNPIYHQGILEKGKIPDPNQNFLLALGASAGAAAGPELLGKDLMNRIYALQLVEIGFNTLSRFKKLETPQIQKKNPAR